MKQLESDNAQVGQDATSSGGSDGRQSCSSLPKPASAGSEAVREFQFIALRQEPNQHYGPIRKTAVGEFSLPQFFAVSH